MKYLIRTASHITFLITQYRSWVLLVTHFKMREPYELKSTAEEEVRVQGYNILGHAFLTLVCEGTRKTNSDISKKTNLK